MAGVAGPFISSASGIEVIYDSKLRIPLPLNMATSVRRENREVLRQVERGGKTVAAAGTTIDFFLDPQLEATWAVAPTSPDFPHPHAENWVSEPFCLLLGELVFPRLVARNFGDRSTIWLRPSPPLNRNTIAASVLQADPLGEHDRFWETYVRILTMIERARDENGGRNFEAHFLTRYYHEIIQATQGSNWAWCLTVASVIEGIAKLLVPDAEKKSDFAPGAIEDLRRHVESWGGDRTLRGRVLDSIGFAETRGVPQLLKSLRSDGAIQSKHISAWKNVRNQVMHGRLVSPWSEPQLDERMQLLTELLHHLSMKYIKDHSS